MEIKNNGKFENSKVKKRSKKSKKVLKIKKNVKNQNLKKRNDLKSTLSRQIDIKLFILFISWKNEGWVGENSWFLFWIQILSC